MSVLIKGMRMPPVGHILMVFPSGRVLEVSSDKTQNVYGEAKAVELPPHGRLIDADAFSAKIIEIVERQKYDDFYDQSLSVGAILREVVNELNGTGLDGYANAPTIIEAEEVSE